MFPNLTYKQSGSLPISYNQSDSEDIFLSREIPDSYSHMPLIPRQIVMLYLEILILIVK